MTTTNAQGSNNKWIWIGLGAALLFCACAALVAFLVFRQAGQKIREGVKNDPVAAAEAAHKIVDSYELPPGYQERVAMDILVYSFVMIAPEAGTAGNAPLIMLAQFSQIGTDRKQMEEQIRQAFEQQSGNRGSNLKLVEVKKMTIRGEEVDVTIFEGTDQNGYILRQLVTSFPGKKGTAMLMIMGSPSAWDETEIDDFLKSIR